EQQRRALRDREEVGGHLAVIGGGPAHNELEDRGPRRDETPRLAAIGLLQAVHQVDLVPGGVLEVDDHFHPLCRRNGEAWYWHGMLEERTVRADRVKGLPIAQEELVHARVRAVQESEAILAPRHPEERLDLAIHQECIAEEAIVVETVVDEE